MQKKQYDLILIVQSETVDYFKYSKLPKDRLELFKKLIYPRMIRYHSGFYGHLDILNHIKTGKFFHEADPMSRRKMFNIWNLPGFNGSHIANYLHHYGIRTKIINNIDAEFDVFKEVYESQDKKPLVGISSTFHLSYTGLYNISAKLFSVDNNIELIVGGAFVNGEMSSGDEGRLKSFISKSGVKYILHSFNSEKDLMELISARKNASDLSKVNNLISSEITTSSVWNGPVLGEGEMSYHLLDRDAINRTVQLRTSSGCPFACMFCSYPVTAGGNHLMSLEQIEQQLVSVLKIERVSRIVFIDDTINVPVNRFNEICKMFKKHEFEWFSFLRVQYINEDIIKIMKESGCVAVYLGVESANDGILNNMNKKATKAQFLNGIKLLKKYGIKSVGAFIIGFPGETEKTIAENIEFIETSGLDYYTLKEFYYMKNTPIFEQREKFGLEGDADKWHHNTMDSNEAYEHKIKMFSKIRGSIFIDPDTSLWQLVYLYDQGFDFDQIDCLLNELNSIMIEQLNGQESISEDRIKKIKTVLGGQKSENDKRVDSQ